MVEILTIRAYANATVPQMEVGLAGHSRGPQIEHSNILGILRHYEVRWRRLQCPENLVDDEATVT